MKIPAHRRRIIAQVLVLTFVVALYVGYLIGVHPGKSVYVNFVSGVSFESSRVGFVNSVTEGATLIYPKTNGNSLDFRVVSHATEKDFLLSKGVALSPLRHIPGTDEVFALFVHEEFTPKVFPLSKNTAYEKATTRQGSPYYSLSSQDSEVVHTIVNTAVAYWIMAQASTRMATDIRETLHIRERSRDSEGGLIATVLDAYILRLKNRQLEHALKLFNGGETSQESLGSLKKKLEIYGYLFDRQFRAIDILYNNNTAIVTGILMHQPGGVYARVRARLQKAGLFTSEWRIESIAVDPDRFGTPTTHALSMN